MSDHLTSSDHTIKRGTTINYLITDANDIPKFKRGIFYRDEFREIGAVVANAVSISRSQAE